MARFNARRDEMLHNVSLETGTNFRAQNLKFTWLGGFFIQDFGVGNWQKVSFAGQALPKLFKPTCAHGNCHYALQKINYVSERLAILKEEYFQETGVSCSSCSADSRIWLDDCVEIM